MGFLRDISPKRAALDLATVWRQDRGNPHRWRILAVSIALTAGLFILLIPKSQRIEPRRPNVTYITTFAPDRTDEEIIASNLANQERKEERQALERQRDERRKELYRTLGQATGLDTEAMEREIAADEAREAAELEAARNARDAVRGDVGEGEGEGEGQAPASE